MNTSTSINIVHTVYTLRSKQFITVHLYKQTHFAVVVVMKKLTRVLLKLSKN